MSKNISPEELKRQHDKMDDHFATIRATLQKPPSAQHWKIIIDQVMYCSNRYSKYHSDVIKRFKSQHLPYIKGALESWPDELRIVESYHLKHTYKLGRVVLIHKPSSTHTKKSIAEDIKLLKSHRYFTGFYVKRINKYLLEHIQAYCELFSKHLHHVHIHASMADKNTNLKSGDIGEDAVRETVTWLLENHGKTIVDLGLDLHNTSKHQTAADALWGPVVERAKELTNLTQLSIGHAIDGYHDTPEHTHWGRIILQNPDFDHIDTLSGPGYLSIPDDALTERPASKNLKRLMLYGGSNEDYKALIQHENLGNLQVMELHPHVSNQLDDSWGTELADHWSYKRAKLLGDPTQIQCHPFLRRTSLVLQNTSIDDLHEIFLDQDNNLVHSDMVEEIKLLSMKLTIDDPLCDALLTQAHIAYPNLKKLSITYPHFTLKDYDNLRTYSELWDQLDSLCIYARISENHENGSTETKENFDELFEPWLALALDKTLHTQLRFMAWRAYRGSNPKTIPFLKKRLKRLGVKYTSKMGHYELDKLLKEATPPELKAEDAKSYY